MSQASCLSRPFFGRDPRSVAPQLLNKVLEHEGRRGRIVEVEAYLGAADPAAHSYRGETPRCRTMFGPPGYLYVYFTYGMHWCANVVCGDHNGLAVLIRALEPMTGLDEMQERRPRARRPRDLCSGPAKLAQALAIDGELDGTDLLAGPVRILDDGTPPPETPEVGTRIGISVAVDEPWRWWVADNPHVSK
ncbi:MAG: DNA-3-methyladenine glycosylase [Actinomycetia bacterium]|nr:DNA-3-methyladenine glycosylase [Actinomycetes bacterium]MCP3911859.1 DNA-3-methyladenine glycosylase [Actinomycetes bacterium]MCP4084617.1 DNA-3-methyladenine glycosylase [Actinomycetes bacterium]